MCKNPNYKDTIIYKIVCNNLDVKYTYVGSTTNFVRRKTEHKSRCNNPECKHYNFKVYQTIRENGGWQNWTMIEIEKYSCNDANEARARERHHYELLNADLNTVCPIRGKQEYRIANAEHIHEIQKKYREENAENLLEYKKRYYKENSEHLREQTKAYRKANADQIREQKKRYRLKNVEKLRVYFRQYYANKKAEKTNQTEQTELI